ncbi:MAG: tRNA (cytidine(34)-2'-O)-methyltransferase [Clostridiales bacterium]|jgi:tRNA (cytidine/uridine-2'-O-)-methyltransferase|nr:tRNA (cytidine(34)-2'-O)-methyltransferase [Clostridiales bacterium]
MINIVLFQPEIPQNTGNIVRTAASTGCRLHLIKPLGFELSDRQLKRAGLDYWNTVDIRVYESYGEFCEKNPGRYFFASTKARLSYDKPGYADGDYIIFGPETRGLPEALIFGNPDTAVRIPMTPDNRSLNLSNSVAIIVYEALRQNGFRGLE